MQLKEVLKEITPEDVLNLAIGINLQIQKTEQILDKAFPNFPARHRQTEIK